MTVEESVASDGSATASVQEKASAAVEASTNVASSAAASAKDVASEAASQVGDVVAQSKQQLSSLVDQTKVELSSQLDQRASQAATGLGSLSTQLQALAEGRTYDAGALADYVREAQQRVQGFATRLDERGAQGLLEDVTAFARRRPVAFLAATAAAGFVVGRVVRAGGAAASNGGAGRPTLGQASIGNGAAAIDRSPVAALSETVDRPYAGLDTGTSAR